LLVIRAGFDSKLQGFVTDLNSFVNSSRVRQKERIPGTKKGYQAVSVNAYRIEKSADVPLTYSRRK
jgi:hypothetical protein